MSKGKKEEISRGKKADFPFEYLNLSKEQMVEEVNRQYKISLKNNLNLVNRVYARYPLIDKSQVALIVKQTFITLRQLLILGKCLRFDGLFVNTWIKFYITICKNGLATACRVFTRTPNSLKGK